MSPWGGEGRTLGCSQSRDPCLTNLDTNSCCVEASRVGRPEVAQMQSGMVLIPLHCVFQQQQQWSLSGHYFFLPTHTWQTEPISSACLKLRLQGHEKGHCPPGWVAAEVKPSERQRPNQQQFSGQLAGSAKPELLALQEGLLLLLPCPPSVQGSA